MTERSRKLREQIHTLLLEASRVRQDITTRGTHKEHPKRGERIDNKDAQLKEERQ